MYLRFYEINPKTSRKVFPHKRALSEYKTRSWAYTLMPSANFYYTRPLSGLLSSFFSLIEGEIRNKGAGKQQQSMPSAIINVTKILKGETKWTVRVTCIR